MKTAEIGTLLDEALECSILDPIVRMRITAARSVMMRRQRREILNSLQRNATKEGGLALSVSAPVSPSSSPRRLRVLDSRGLTMKPLEIVWRHPCEGKVSVYGTFTEPPWSEIKMARDTKEKCFRVDLSDWGLSPGTYIFKFVVDGEWRIDPTLTTRQDLNGQVNNTMFIRSSLRPLKTVRSAPSVEVMSESARPALRETTTQQVSHHRIEEEGLGRESSGLALVCGGWMIPHPEKIASGGADSFFFSSNAAGIADGVGEWEWRFKLDPRKFAEQLMKGCLVAASEKTDSTSSSSSAEETAQRILTEGYDLAKAFGSSTACVASLDDKGERLGIANLGDSGLVHFRKQFLTGAFSMTCVMRTREQQHSFNTPFQLSRVPDPKNFDEISHDPMYSELITALRSLSGRQLSGMDTPADCELYSSKVKEGDLIVLATDGVLDNLWNYDLLSVVGEAACVSPFDARMKIGDSPTDPEQIAKAIATAAYEKSVLTGGYKSPFGVECRRRTGQVHLGGKPDDITVVVGWVCRKQDLLAGFKGTTCRDWWRAQQGRTRNSSSDDVRRKSRFEQFT